MSEYMWRNGIKLRYGRVQGCTLLCACLCDMLAPTLTTFPLNFRPSLLSRGLHWVHCPQCSGCRHIGPPSLVHASISRPSLPPLPTPDSPYIYDAVQLLDSIEFPSSTKPDGLEFVHFPIVDCAVVSDTRVLRLCKDLVKRLLKGENMYIHCWSVPPPPPHRLSCRLQRSRTTGGFNRLRLRRLLPCCGCGCWLLVVPAPALVGCPLPLFQLLSLA